MCPRQLGIPLRTTSSVSPRMALGPTHPLVSIKYLLPRE